MWVEELLSCSWWTLAGYDVYSISDHHGFGDGCEGVTADDGGSSETKSRDGCASCPWPWISVGVGGGSCSRSSCFKIIPEVTSIAWDRSVVDADRGVDSRGEGERGETCRGEFIPRRRSRSRLKL